MFAPTVRLAGVVSRDDGNGVAVWKILDGTRVLLVVSIDTILLGLNVGVFMTILLNFVGTFRSFAAIGIERAAIGLAGDVIDGIVIVTGVAAVVAVDGGVAFFAIFCDLSANRGIRLGKIEEKNWLKLYTNLHGIRCYYTSK